MEAQHVLQYIWSDLTFDFSVIASQFTSHHDFNADQLHAHFWQVIEGLEKCGLSTSLVVCDGCTTNLSFVARNTGRRLDPSFNQPLVNSFCYNRFSDRSLYFMVDPPHLCKSVRNWMESSHANGNRSKLFETESGRIVWDDILSCYAWGEANRYSGIRNPSFLTADAVKFSSSWGKMNVALARKVNSLRIFALLTKLRLNGSCNVSKGSIQFIFVFASLFEFFFFKKNLKIWSMDSLAPHWGHLIRALMYIRNWSEFKIKNTKPDNSFLSPISVSGIMLTLETLILFCFDFFKRNESANRRTKFILPFRLHQNLIEALFAGIKRVGDSGKQTVHQLPRATAGFSYKRVELGSRRSNISGQSVGQKGLFGPRTKAHQIHDRLIEKKSPTTILKCENQRKTQFKPGNRGRAQFKAP